MIAMVTATVFFALAALFGHDGSRPETSTAGGFVLTLIGFAVLTLGGWLGGAIVYVHGMRVLNLVEEPPGGRSRRSRIPRRKRPRAPSALEAWRLRRGRAALERALGLRADRGCRGLAVLEQDHRRDRHDAVAQRELLLLVDVHLHELELACALVDDPLEHRRDGVARAAPLGPEVDDDRLRRSARTSARRSFRSLRCHVGSFRFSCGCYLIETRRQEPVCSRSLESKHATHVRAASACPRPSRARARDPRALGARADVRAAPRAEPRRAALQLHRRPDHGEQPDGRPPRLGPDAQGRLPALQGAARLRPALPERLRLPGPLGRGRGREGARARTRSARSRSTASRSSPSAARSASRSYAEVITEQSKRLGMWMDWDDDYYTFSRHEHRVHLALPQGGARARLALQGPPLDAVVPALRHVALPARAGRRGELRRARAPVALRPLPAAGPRRRVARRLDDDALDAARERRGGRPARGRVRRSRDGEWVAVARMPDGDVRRARARRGSRRSRVRGPVRRPAGAGRASSTA